MLAPGMTEKGAPTQLEDELVAQRQPVVRGDSGDDLRQAHQPMRDVGRQVAHRIGERVARTRILRRINRCEALGGHSAGRKIGI